MPIKAAITTAALLPFASLFQKLEESSGAKIGMNGGPELVAVCKEEVVVGWST